jgi:AcrR family transcriptional regulator
MLTKSKKKVRGDIRREQIVQAAMKIVGAGGMNRLTTAAIARQMGMSEANLYRHVKNKDEIYSACTDYVRTKIWENIESASSAKGTPVEILKRFFFLQVELIETNRGLPRFLFSDDLHVNKKIRDRVINAMYEFSTRLASLIRQGQRMKLVQGDLDPRTTALMFIGMIQGLAFRWSLSGFSFSLSKEGMKVWKNYVRCIVV